MADEKSERAHDIDKPFLMPIEEVSSTPSRGAVVTGRISRGVVKAGDQVEIIGSRDARRSVVMAVEMFSKLIDQGKPGDNVGCFLQGVQKHEIEPGQVLAKLGSITPHTKFTAEVYVLTREEGGGKTPFSADSRPELYLHSHNVTGTCKLPEGVTTVMQGDTVTMTIELTAPVALEEQLHFGVRVDGRTVADGVVTKILV